MTYEDEDVASMIPVFYLALLPSLGLRMSNEH